MIFFSFIILNILNKFLHLSFLFFINWRNCLFFLLFNNFLLLFLLLFNNFWLFRFLLLFSIDDCDWCYWSSNGLFFLFLFLLLNNLLLLLYDWSSRFLFLLFLLLFNGWNNWSGNCLFFFFFFLLLYDFSKWFLFHLNKILGNPIWPISISIFYLKQLQSQSLQNLIIYSVILLKILKIGLIIDE